MRAQDSGVVTGGRWFKAISVLSWLATAVALFVPDAGTMWLYPLFIAIVSGWIGSNCISYAVTKDQIDRG